MGYGFVLYENEDNAKKAIEIMRAEAAEPSQELIAAHKASVTGDTVGDTRKDVVGVAIDIFIKSMATVANTFAMSFKSYHLF